MRPSNSNNDKAQSSKQTEQMEGFKLKRRKSESTNCHQCHRNDKGRVVRCNNCGKQYCTPCITRSYPMLNEASFAEACAICRNICNCGSCLQSEVEDKEFMVHDLKLSSDEELYYSKYIVRELLPSLKKYVVEQNMEIEEAAKLQELLLKAEAIRLDVSRDGLQMSQGSCSCSRPYHGSDVQRKYTLKAAFREQSNDNILYFPQDMDTEKPDLRHFQFHLSRGEPVVVGNVLRRAFGLSWDPIIVERAFRASVKHDRNALDVTAINCVNWCQEKINIRRFFEGYSEGGIIDSQGIHKILKLEGWPPSDTFQNQMPRHFAELIRCLPFKHYTHPASGCLNIATKLPNISTKELGPRMCFSYGPCRSHQGCQWGSVTNLHYGVADKVNILMHFAISHVSQDSEGIVWDIFRRQDVPKLEEYLRKHAKEFGQTLPLHHVVSAVHEQIFYLTAEHKRELRDEYGIEPWSFVQTLGDAVFIPAGCPHQMRNLKSCINVAVDFVSPESVATCRRLSNERRSLPSNHPQKEEKLQVRQMALNAVGQAVEVLDKSTPHQSAAEKPSLEYIRQDVEAMKRRLEREGHTLSQQKRAMLEMEIQGFLNKYFPGEGSFSSSRPQ